MSRCPAYRDLHAAAFWTFCFAGVAGLLNALMGEQAAAFVAAGNIVLFVAAIARFVVVSVPRGERELIRGSGDERLTPAGPCRRARLTAPGGVSSGAAQAQRSRLT
ncbi:MAG: hypothetical protein F4151_01930 [Gammaproteobacteria bacterium]|nr:hypothetical protein [Dehalococcoidia bacterium]MYH48305.1 hypothetical protein [Gammaproteobacteria bacterium]